MEGGFKHGLTFAGGAVVAATLVYFTMRGGKPPEAVPPSAVVQTPAPTVAPVASPTPEPDKLVPEPSRVPARKPSAMSPAHSTATQHPDHGGQIHKSDTIASAPLPQNVPPYAAPPPTVPTVVQPPSAPATEIKRHEPPPPPAREPQKATIPAGTLISVRIDDRLSSETVKIGDTFRATLDQPLVVDGFVLAERGARAEGRIVDVDPGGRVRGLAHMALELVRVNTSDGQRIKVVTASFAKEAQQSRTKDVAKVGAAAGIGAAIGAIAGGGKGAAIGAAVGGAAGTGGVLATRGGAAEIAPETRVSFRLSEAVTVTEKLH